MIIKGSLIACGLASLVLAGCAGSVGSSTASIHDSSSGSLMGKNVSDVKYDLSKGKKRGKSKTIYLTFDDGPARDTSRLLKILKKYNAKATFFMAGNMVAGRKGVVQRVVKDGHAIGNHTWSHPDLRRLSAGQVKSQLTKTIRAVPQMGDCYRAPYGARNGTVNSVAKQLGLKHYGWQIDTNDWRSPSVARLTKQITKAKNGDIVLMHDGPTGRGRTVDAVKKALPILYKKGYITKTLKSCRV